MRHISQLATFIALVATAPTICADVIYVSKAATAPSDGNSWTAAFTNLQDAIAAAVPGDQIWVAQGTYRPDEGGGQTAGDREAWFLLPNHVALYGGFDGTESSLEQRAELFEQTILSGDLEGDDLPGFINNSDNSFHVIRSAGGTPSTILDGFCVTSGNAIDDTVLHHGAGLWATNSSQTIRNCIFKQNRSVSGGAVLLQSGTKVSISDCAFLDNQALYQGGAIYVGGLEISAVRCDFLNNSIEPDPALPPVEVCLGPYSGGAIYATTSTFVRLTDCLFEDNRSLEGCGGAIYSPDSGSVVRCTFRNNSSKSGGAIKSQLLDLDQEFHILACQFVHNTSLQRGGALDSFHCTVLNSSFQGNTSTNGGAAYVGTSIPASFTGCWFSGNTATSYGGAIYMGSTESRIDSCSIVGNSAGIGVGGVLVPGVSESIFTIDCKISNSILWNNTDASGTGESAQTKSIDTSHSPPPSPSLGMISVESSVIQGLTGELGSIGNISSDPQFVDLDGPDDVLGTEDDNPKLKRSSPALDAGNAALLPADTFDLDADGDLLEPLPLTSTGLPRILDSNGDGVAEVDMGAEEFATLTVDVVSLPTSSGGNARFTLEAGLPNSLSAYWILGSASGTSPGINLSNGLVLPLNFDAYTKLTRMHPTAPIFTGSFFGALDANGSGRATLSLPPIAPSLAGLELSHAFLTFDSFGSLKFSSNAITLLLMP